MYVWFTPVSGQVGVPSVTLWFLATYFVDSPISPALSVTGNWQVTLAQEWAYAPNVLSRPGGFQWTCGLQTSTPADLLFY